MDEAKKVEKELQKVTTKNNDDGSKPTADEIIKRTNTAAERMEAANKERERILEQEKELFAKRQLGGNSEAGFVPEKPKELTPQEYAQAVRDGKINPLL